MTTGSLYEIGRPTGACAATGDPIRPGERFVAVLIEPEPAASWLRSDYALQAWEGGARPQPPAEIVAFWRMRMPEPGVKKNALIDTEELLDLFLRLADQTSRRAQVLRYLLALILLRKRLVRIDSPGREGALTLRLVGKADTGPIEVPDPQMDEAAIADAIEQLGVVMLGEGDR